MEYQKPTVARARALHARTHAHSHSLSHIVHVVPAALVIALRSVYNHVREK